MDTKGNSKHNKITDTISKVLKIIIPSGISVALVVWLFHKVNIHQIIAIAREGVEYRYIVLMMLLTMLSFIIRGVRWGIQLRAAGVPRLPVMTECVSIFGAYALNLVITYLGEAWRVLYISRRGKAKFSTVLGTDIGDRASDAVMILLLIGLTLIVGKSYLIHFIDQYSLGESIKHIFDSTATWIGVGVGIVILAALDYLFRDSAPVKKFNSSIKRTWSGFAVLFHMKGTFAYIILTFGIWICYYLETYFCFFAFPFTRELITQPGLAYGLLPGLVVFVFGSCSMAIPSSGGLGPWNIAVMFALSLFGIAETDGAAYAMVCWSFQTIMIILLGIFSAIYVMATKHQSLPGNGTPTPATTSPNSQS